MRYASIRKMDVSNGEGVGISLFVQGCPYHCLNCFNQETWDFNGGKEWTVDVEDKFLNLANKSQISRISILGGEPLCKENVKTVCHIIQRIRQEYGSEKKVWLYTGSTWEQIRPNLYSESVLDDYTSWWNREGPKITVRDSDVLVDGAYVHELRDITLPFRGSRNQRVIDVKKTLASPNGEIILYSLEN